MATPPGVLRRRQKRTKSRSADTKIGSPLSRSIPAATIFYHFALARVPSRVALVRLQEAMRQEPRSNASRILLHPADEEEEFLSAGARRRSLRFLGQKCLPLRGGHRAARSIRYEEGDAGSARSGCADEVDLFDAGWRQRRWRVLRVCPDALLIAPKDDAIRWSIAARRRPVCIIVKTRNADGRVTGGSAAPTGHLDAYHAPERRSQPLPLSAAGRAGVAADWIPTLR